jgi:dienelactone hydrolase
MQFPRYFILMILVYVTACANAQETLRRAQEYLPHAERGHPVIVISGRSGPDYYRDFAKEMADRGFFAVLVDGNTFWPMNDEGETALRTAISSAQGSPHALPGKVAVIGFSLGGASSLAYATAMPELVSAVVAYYPLTDFITDPSSFVSRIKVPTLLLVGGRDTYMNCCLIGTARILVKSARPTDRPGLLKVVEYPDADHGWTIKSLDTWREHDAADALQHTLSHLKNSFGE